MLFAHRVLALERALARVPSLLVACSGGVDSAALLGAAARVLPPGRLLAATTVSPAVPAEEATLAAATAARLGVPHRVLETAELDDPDYAANRGNRCYFCRREMYGVLRALADEAGMERVADGLQADDLVHDRPGVQAAKERGILHPLRDAGLGKAGVRRLARACGLPEAVHARPAQPCLASRLPAGVPVTAVRLARVHRAEAAVRALGFRIVRVRCEPRRHGRIEVGAAEVARACRQRGALEDAVRGAGFATAALDPRGYR